MTMLDLLWAVPLAGIYRVRLCFELSCLLSSLLQSMSNWNFLSPISVGVQVVHVDQKLFNCYTQKKEAYTSLMAVLHDSIAVATFVVLNDSSQISIICDPLSENNCCN